MTETDETYSREEMSALLETAKQRAVLQVLDEVQYVLESNTIDYTVKRIQNIRSTIEQQVCEHDFHDTGRQGSTGDSKYMKCSKCHATYWTGKTW